jgi:mediator of RNA polymerase II transcription subunit 10
MESSRNSSAPAVAGGGNDNHRSRNSDASATRASETGDDPKQNLNQVINSIQKTLGLIHQLYLTVSSFNVASQLPLLQRLNSLVLELDNMTKLAEECNIQVPLHILNLIDDGKNPDEFTRDILNDCIARNQITKGKTDAFKGFRKHLLEELEQAFPDEVESYREIRASSAAESKRLALVQSTLPNGDVVKPEL